MENRQENTNRPFLLIVKLFMSRGRCHFGKTTLTASVLFQKIEDRGYAKFRNESGAMESWDRLAVLLKEKRAEQ